MGRVRFALMCGALMVAALAQAVPAAAAAPPTVTTEAATGVTNTGAVLNGTVNPNGAQTQYAFQWGPTAGYGHETALSSAGAGSATEPIAATLSGLAPGSTYHFRTIAISSAGVSVGADQSLTTTGVAPAPSTPPTAATGAASTIGPTSATLRGTINPKGQATTYYFEYGTTADYGFETAAVSGGSGTSDKSVSARITGLIPGTGYHFRVVAVSAGGTTLGADSTLATFSPPGVLTGAASNVHDSFLTLNGTVNPQGHSTTYYFQFGTTTAYGLQTPPAGAGSGAENVAVHADIAGLMPGATYHYRLVARSSGGTSLGLDRTVRTSGAPVIPSRVAILGKMGFVSSRGWIGVVIGCFGGQTRCVGHVTLTHGRTVVGRRNFNIRAASGGFQNLRLTAKGRKVLRRSRGPLRVTARIVATNGQRISVPMRLARWS
jgi:phosphodiesterase/alkaline phosphatase D-like protein